MELSNHRDRLKAKRLRTSILKHHYCSRNAASVLIKWSPQKANTGVAILSSSAQHTLASTQSGENMSANSLSNFRGSALDPLLLFGSRHRKSIAETHFYGCK